MTFDGPDLDAVAAGIGCTTTSVIDALVGTELLVAFSGLPPDSLTWSAYRPNWRRSPAAHAPNLGTCRFGRGGWRICRRVPPVHSRRLDAARTYRRQDCSIPTSLPMRCSGPVTPSASRSVPRRPGWTRWDPPGPTGRGTRGHRCGAHGDRYVEVLDPGLLSLVEDAGRRSVADMGIPSAGAADPESHATGQSVGRQPRTGRDHRDHRGGSEASLQRRRPSGGGGVERRRGGRAHRWPRRGHRHRRSRP